jgi:formylglycine-generating enzyme required for sulfatase activity
MTIRATFFLLTAMTTFLVQDDLNVRVNPVDGSEYAWIPPGTALLGCSENEETCSFFEAPQREAVFPVGFWIGRTEVTAGSYADYCGESSRPLPEAPFFNQTWEHREHPVVNVTWQEAQDYCRWIGGRLPTEAEWEYAARGGATTKFPWGQQLSHDHANYAIVSQEDSTDFILREVLDLWDQTAPVASFSQNRFRLFDMIGNVEEWTADEFRALRITSAPPDGSSVCERTVRGGSWASRSEGALRPSFRYGRRPGKGTAITGFRCIWEAPAADQ